MPANTRKRIQHRRRLIFSCLLFCAAIAPLLGVRAAKVRTTPSSRHRRASPGPPAHRRTHLQRSQPERPASCATPSGARTANGSPTSAGPKRSSGPQIWAVDAASGQRHVLVDNDHLRNSPAAARVARPADRPRPPHAAQYLWSPDSKALLFISAQELFWYDLAAQTSRRLIVAPPRGSVSGRRKRRATTDTTIDDAKISPDGRWASFLRAHDIWVVSVAGGEPRQITRGGTEDAPQRRTRLGLSRGTGPATRLLVVARLQRKLPSSSWTRAT